MKSQCIFLFLVFSVFCQLFLQTSSFGNTSQQTPPVSHPDAAVVQKHNPGDTLKMASPAAKRQPRLDFLLRWLHMLDRLENAEVDTIGVMAFAPQVPVDLARIFMISKDPGETGLWAVFWRTIVAIGLALLVVSGVRRIAHRSVSQFEQLTAPANDTFSCLWVGALRSIPALAGLVLLTVTAIAVFLFLAGEISIGARMLFQVVLGTVMVGFACRIIGLIIFAPDDKSVRPFLLGDEIAIPLYRAFITAAMVLLSGMLFVYLIRELGALPQTVTWVAILLGTMVIGVFAGLVVYLRRPVAATLQADNSVDETGWLVKQLAVYWHVVALFYLLLVWFVFLAREITGTMPNNGSFLISLIIVPLYLVLSHAGYIVITAVIDSLGLGTLPPADHELAGRNAAHEQQIIIRKRAIVRKTILIFRLVLAVVLAIWLFSLWGYQIPFAQRAVRAIFESLVVIGLALVAWRFTSAYIARKIDEVVEPHEKNEEDVDDEFGGAVARGRSYTLLPMLRKVIGSTLVVMVILIVLSSLGVNIGPLLAGAGVVGLAVGFGAQKLVSDILSGFFFLLDDAFRVGEYIKTGSIQGTVESITLRNVMLRHHLGMLQVVPHSDLGAVTNFMRGGMVIKFPLEFPYDTDIDKVRKIIKQVGQDMMEDEEMADAFLQPLKSQGVYNISNSVMVIRVKFTAKPGKQFLIKREAFRLITEALKARGIHYAHRKVIVDFPDSVQKTPVDQQANAKALQAGGAVAAVLAAEEEAERMKAEEEKK